LPYPVKAHLQDHCWFFSGLDINRDGWTPGIDGDGAMVSGAGSNPLQHGGIYSPLLEVWVISPFLLNTNSMVQLVMVCGDG